MFGSKQGYTLPLTIVILLVIGYLSFSFYEMVKRERMESFRRYKDVQSTLELESAANYAFYRMSIAKEPWRTDSLLHTSKDGNIKFFIRHVQDGPFARLTALNQDSTKVFSATTGFVPQNRPALVLSASQSSIALVGNARIEGGTALKQGRVSYSTHYKNRAGKDAFYDTVFVSDTLPYFKDSRYYPELSRNSFEKKFDKQSCVFDGTDKISGELKCSMVIMQGDARCDHCRIIADRLFIRGRSSLNKANVIARTISLKDSVFANGTFFAQDSMEVDLKLPQNNPVWFVVQGKKSSDVDYIGYMSIQRLKASQAAILFYGDNWDESLKASPVEISENADITGSIVINGVVDFKGKLKGNMTVHNFAFYEGETLWRGFLKGGQIKGDTSVHVMLPDVIQFGGVPSYE